MSALYGNEENDRYGGYQPASYMGTQRSKIGRQSQVKSRAASAKPSELRDLLATVDSLKREISRKDVRNEGLAKELSSVRTIAVAGTREIKILRDTYEKLNMEKQGLVSDIGRRRDKESKMEAQLGRMENAHEVLLQNQELRAEVDSLQRRVDSSSSTMAVKNEKVAALEREVEIMGRAFEVEKKYDGQGNKGAAYGLEGLGSVVQDVNHSRDVMRSLYYELGKRQTDAHGMALTIAELQKENKMSRARQTEQEQALDGVHEEVDCLKAHCDQLLKQSVHDADEMGGLRDDKLRLEEHSHKLAEQLEEVSRRLAEQLVLSEEEAKESARIYEEQRHVAEAATRELAHLRTQVDAMQMSLTHAESVQRISDSRNSEERKDIADLRQELARERQSVSRERDELSKSCGALGKEKDDFSVTQHRVAIQNEELVRKERELVCMRAEIDSAKQGLEDSRKTLQQLNMAREESTKLVMDKDEALGTLERAMGMVRDLSSKLAVEKAGTKDAADKVEALQRSKEQVSAAVLDALHKERAKNARLQAALDTIRGGPSFVGVQSSSSVGSAVRERESVLLDRKVQDTYVPTRPVVPAEDAVLTRFKSELDQLQGEHTGSYSS